VLINLKLSLHFFDVGFIVSRRKQNQGRRPNKKNKPKPNKRDFYRSEAWRKLRYEALKLYGGECMLCGKSKHKDDAILHVDHIKPRSKYPDLALELKNLQVLCEDCNIGKGTWDESDWRALQTIADRHILSVHNKA